MADKYYGWSPFNYTLNNPIKYTDPNGKIVDDSDVKDSKAFKDYSSTKQGKKYLSLFRPGGKYKNIIVKFTEKYSTWGDGEAISGHLDENGKFVQGESSDGAQMVVIVYIGKQLNRSNTNLKSYCSAINAYSHEIQHAILMSAMARGDMKKYSQHDIMSTFSYTEERMEASQEINARYNLGLDKNDLLKETMDFLGFNKEIYNYTKNKKK